MGAGDPGIDPDITPRKQLPTRVHGPPTIEECEWVAGVLPAHKFEGPSGMANLVLRNPGVVQLMHHWDTLTCGDNPSLL